MRPSAALDLCVEEGGAMCAHASSCPTCFHAYARLRLAAARPRGGDAGIIELAEGTWRAAPGPGAPAWRLAGGDVVLRLGGGWQPTRAYDWRADAAVALEPVSDREWSLGSVADLAGAPLQVWIEADAGRHVLPVIVMEA